jgi:hypothetical protein
MAGSHSFVFGCLFIHLRARFGVVLLWMVFSLNAVSGTASRDRANRWLTVTRANSLMRSSPVRKQHQQNDNFLSALMLWFRNPTLLTIIGPLTLTGCIRETAAFAEFAADIPNGLTVPYPDLQGGVWAGVGHTNAGGGGGLNVFGYDFSSAGYKWTVALCKKDSDGDGRSNGVELGDPNCVWKAGTGAPELPAQSHPGIVDKPAPKVPVKASPVMKPAAPKTAPVKPAPKVPVKASPMMKPAAPKTAPVKPAAPKAPTKVGPVKPNTPVKAPVNAAPVKPVAPKAALQVAPMKAPVKVAPTKPVA